MLYPVELRAPPRESANLRRENVASTQAPSDLTFSERLSIVEHESPTSECGAARNSHGMTILLERCLLQVSRKPWQFFRIAARDADAIQSRNWKAGPRVSRQP